MFGSILLLTLKMRKQNRKLKGEKCVCRFALYLGIETVSSYLVVSLLFVNAGILNHLLLNHKQPSYLDRGFGCTSGSAIKFKEMFMGFLFSALGWG